MLPENPDIERIVLGGDQRLANTVLGAVHPAVQEKVIAVLPIPMELPPHEIADRIRYGRTGRARYEDALVTEVIDQAKAGGRGATGQVAVGRALDRAAVRLLALPYPADEATEPLLLQAVQQGSQVEFLHGEAAERAMRKPVASSPNCIMQSVSGRHSDKETNKDAGARQPGENRPVCARLLYGLPTINGSRTERTTAWKFCQ
ncbi:MAG: hypothetical protein IPM60_15380 [Rhodospirillales bacterium]|nr:hypothetical protein [Rhodospirillales bacterium]